MAKGRRKRVGDFSVGDRVSAGAISGIIESFPSRRIAIVRDDNEGDVEVSTLDLRREDGDEGQD